MKTGKLIIIFGFLSLFGISRAYATDINEIVYPPPEPEKVSPDDQDKNASGDTNEPQEEEKKPGITEEIQDKDKMNKIYVYPDGRVLVPGTTPFESVDEYEKRQKNQGDDSGYHDHHHNDHHHKKPDYQIEPQLSEKKGRTKSKLGITGPGYIFVPAKEGKR